MKQNLLTSEGSNDTFFDGRGICTIGIGWSDRGKKTNGSWGELFFLCFWGSAWVVCGRKVGGKDEGIQKVDKCHFLTTVDADVINETSFTILN